MSKFKIGDIVKIREDLDDELYNNFSMKKDVSRFKGKITTINNISPVLSESMYKLNIDSEKHLWYEGILELYELTLDDIQFGDILTLRNGERYVYADYYIYGEKGDYALDFTKLKKTHNDKLKTMDIFSPAYDYNMVNYDIIKVERQGQIIFERKEKVVEMTLKEICEKLGYDVKIVKQKNEE